MKPLKLLILLLITSTCFGQGSSVGELNIPAPPSVFVLPFDKDHYYFNSTDIHRMDDIIDSLRENPEWKISIQGHAHHREANNSPTQQMHLSRMRANVVKAYFVSYFIQESRILDCIGFGTDRPVNKSIPNLNWRTEVFLLKN